VCGRRLKQWLAFGLAILVSALPVLARSASREPVTVIISMHNDVGVAWDTLRAAEEETSLVLREAGIDIQWRNCPETSQKHESKNCAEAAFPKHLHLRIAKRSVGLSPDAMGISFLSQDGTGCQADLFFEEMQALRERSNVSMANILGHVAAHEIGHLLLGTNSHAPLGIMRAVWGPEELSSARRTALLFSEKQSEQMRARLERFAAQTRPPCTSDQQLGDCTL
jgi:hypothetical protein